MLYGNLVMYVKDIVTLRLDVAVRVMQCFVKNNIVTCY